jgi:hypothetical protein
MRAMDVYIWGIRYGFKPNEALYPDRVHIAGDDARMRQYAQITRNFTEDKDYKFRMCERDFYFIKSDNNYRSYSLVYSGHKDIQGRQSYLVFTIVLPFHLYPKGDVIKALNNLKNLYKSKNIDYKVDRNLFTQQQIYEQVSHLSEDAGRTVIADSNAIFYYSDINQLTNLFTDYTGDELYFIQEGSNSEMVAAFGYSTIRQLAQVQKDKQFKEESLKRFTAIFKNRRKEDAAELASLFSHCSNNLDRRIRQDYEDWSNKVASDQRNGEVITKFKSMLVQAKDKGYRLDTDDANNLYKQYQRAIDAALSSDEKKIFEEWRKTFETHQLTTAESKLKEILHRARREGWQMNPDESLSGIPAVLLNTAPYKDEVSIWRYEYQASLKERVFTNVDNLFNRIQKSSRAEKRKNQRKWKSDIAELKSHVENLLDREERTSLKNRSDYQYLISYEWVPKSLKYLIAGLGVCVLALVAIFFVMTWDTDKDGVANLDDSEPETIWFEKTIIPLSDYVNPTEAGDSAGKINIRKLKVLCDSCGTITDDSDWSRVCKAVSKDYCLYNRILYKKNADSTYKIVCGDPKASLDPKVAEQLDKYFAIDRKRNQNSSTLGVTVNADDERVKVSFEDNNYMVSNKFTSDTGAVFNNRRYKYALASGWMCSENIAKPWKTAQKQDINFMLNSLCGAGRAEMVKSTTAQSNSTTITGSQNAGQTNNNQGANAAVKSQDNYAKVDCDGKVDSYLSNSGSINVAKIDSEGKDSVRKKLNCSCRDEKKEQKRVQIVKYCSK